ncbi:MAG: sensor histidine kinase [Rudaea sp.]
MSIRLRLTVLFSSILALTLIAFSVLLFLFQSRVTFDSIRATLAAQARLISLREHRPSRESDNPAAGTVFPGRWTQLRGPDGGITSRSSDLGDATLPLSAAGLRAVQGGRPWSEVARVDDEPILIYSLPVMSQSGVAAIIQVAAPIAEREASLAALRLILIIGSALAILLAFVAGWWLAGAALQPINRITHTAQAIGAEGDFSRRVDYHGPNDEVGQLAVTFNGMLTELESQFRRVETLLHSQRRFVADASHELRTPLTTIRGNIGLLRREPPVEGTERALILADTQDETERLIRLVNQLLTLARSDAGRRLVREPINLRPLVEDACRQANLLAPQRTVSCEAADATVLGDRDALKQVLLILLDNALVHTPARAAVAVVTTLADDRASISVRDSGPGIAPGLLPHIFERFYRGNPARSGPGTGLGLSIARELVEEQGGTITAESRVGKGTVFTVSLPRATDRQEPASPAPKAVTVAGRQIRTAP